MLVKLIVASVGAIALIAVAGSAQAAPSATALASAMPNTSASSSVQEVRWWGWGHRRDHRRNWRRRGW